MSLYNMLFGMNGQADLLLAVIGLKKCDVERFRDISASEDGATITVYTRTGGDNREDYPNVTLRSATGFIGSTDDEFDNTYCTDRFSVAQEWVKDVAALRDIFANGMRKEFAVYLAKTLRREPTDADKAQLAYDKERDTLSRTKHFMANGHTFVPVDDSAMQKALELAEANGGELRSCWGILPIKLITHNGRQPYPNAQSESDRQYLIRAEINYDFKWGIDVEYWDHCRKRWNEQFPLAMAKIAESIAAHMKEVK